MGDWPRATPSLFPDSHSFLRLHWRGPLTPVGILPSEIPRLEVRVALLGILCMFTHMRPQSPREHMSVLKRFYPTNTHARGRAMVLYNSVSGRHQVPLPLGFLSTLLLLPKPLGISGLQLRVLASSSGMPWRMPLNTLASMAKKLDPDHSPKLLSLLHHRHSLVWAVRDLLLRSFGGNPAFSIFQDTILMRASFLKCEPREED